MGISDSLIRKAICWWGGGILSRVLSQDISGGGEFILRERERERGY